MAENILKSIPLDEIIKDWRVQEHIRKRAREMARKTIDSSLDRQSQVQSCHAWLLCLHYEAINRLQGKHRISKPQFIVLMAAYLLKRKGKGGFTARTIRTTLVNWQYNKIYRHLNKLAGQGLVEIEREPHSNLRRYWLSNEGEGVIMAFNQHFYRVWGEVRDNLGELPASFRKFTII